MNVARLATNRGRSRPRPKQGRFADAFWLFSREQEFPRLIAGVGWRWDRKRRGFYKDGVQLDSPKGREKDPWAYEALRLNDRFAELRKAFRGASPKIIRTAGAAFEIGAVWGALSSKGSELFLHEKGPPAVEDSDVYFWIQVAAEGFYGHPKNRHLKPRFKDITDNWDPTCGFAITPQRFTAWRKSGVGFVFAGPLFQHTSPLGGILPK